MIVDVNTKQNTHVTAISSTEWFQEKHMTLMFETFPQMTCPKLLF